ncbi:hypothetical protein CRUP_021330 [Coryphaenoides rupestris]|nr:hypothetical protein CRUP_021330 [Coryphaenoides rupestris]
MEAAHRELLRRHRLLLSEQLLVRSSSSSSVLLLLYQEGVLTLAQLQEVQAQDSDQQGALRLLDLLPTRGPRAFPLFLEALGPDYPWIREALMGALEALEPDERRVPEAVLGRVPSDRELSRLASLLGPEWESLLLHLGLSTGALFRCRADHPHSAQGQALAGMVGWRQAGGRAATVGRLLDALRAVDVDPSVLGDVFQ